MSRRPRLAVSACLMGENVRYDGQNKRDAQVRALDAHFELVPVCPEVAIGLGVPRPTLGLYDTDKGIRIRRHEDPDFDVTEALMAYGRRLAETNYCGLVLKARSPSCAIDDAPVLDAQGAIIGTAAGGFVLGLRLVNDIVPMINEEALRDDRIRQAFITSVQTYAAQAQQP